MLASLASDGKRALGLQCSGSDGDERDPPLPTEGFEFWSLDVNGGDEWKVEDLSRDQRKEFPNDQVKKYFVTSY